MAVTLTTAQMESVVIQYFQDHEREVEIKEFQTQEYGGEPEKYFEFKNGVRSGTKGYAYFSFQGNHWTRTTGDFNFDETAPKIDIGRERFIALDPDIAYQTRDMSKKRIASVNNAAEMLELLKTHVLFSDFQSITTEKIKKAVITYMEDCGVQSYLIESMPDIDSERGDSIMYIQMPSIQPRGIFAVDKGNLALKFHGPREKSYRRTLNDEFQWQKIPSRFLWGYEECALINSLDDIPGTLQKLLPLKVSDPALTRLVDIVGKILKRIEEMEANVAK